MEDTRPDKWEETASEVTNEAHEEREVRDKDSKQDGDQNTGNSEATAPDLELAILRPDGGEWSLGLAFEQFLFN